MLVNVIVIAGFIVSAVLVHFAIDRIFDVVDPVHASEPAKLPVKYRVMAETPELLDMLMPYFSLDECIFFVGTKEEICYEMEEGNIDCAVMESSIDTGNVYNNTCRKNKNYALTILYRDPAGQHAENPEGLQETEIYYQPVFSEVIAHIIRERVLLSRSA